MANNVSGTTITLRHEWPASASGLATFSVTSSAKTQRNTNGATKNSAIRTSQPHNLLPLGSLDIVVVCSLLSGLICVGPVSVWCCLDMPLFEFDLGSRWV